MFWGGMKVEAVYSRPGAKDRGSRVVEVANTKAECRSESPDIKDAYMR